MGRGERQLQTKKIVGRDEKSGNRREQESKKRGRGKKPENSRYRDWWEPEVGRGERERVRRFMRVVAAGIQVELVEGQF